MRWKETYLWRWQCNEKEVMIIILSGRDLLSSFVIRVNKRSLLSSWVNKRQDIARELRWRKLIFIRKCFVMMMMEKGRAHNYNIRCYFLCSAPLREKRINWNFILLSEWTERKGRVRWKGLRRELHHYHYCIFSFLSLFRSVLFIVMAMLCESSSSRACIV